MWTYIQNLKEKWMRHPPDISMRMVPPRLSHHTKIEGKKNKAYCAALRPWTTLSSASSFHFVQTT